jgi:hypothetical protein
VDIDTQHECGEPLVRRPMKADEWSEDYLLSLVKMHQIGAACSKDLDLIRGWLDSSMPMGLAEAVINSDGGWRTDVTRPQYGGTPFPRWVTVLRSMPIRYCPMCFSEDRYIRGRWRIPSLLVCTLHGCYLKDDLKDPALTPTRKGEQVLIRAKASDAALLKGAICCLPEEHKIVKAIWGPFEQAASSSHQPMQDDELGELLAWTLLAWRVVESVALAHVKIVQREQAIGRLPSMARLFKAFGLTVSPDKKGVVRFLKGLRHNVHFMTAYRTFRYLLNAERTRQTVMGHLPLQELQELCAAAAPRPEGHANPGEVAFPEEMARGMSRVQVMALLGASESAVNHWMSNGWLPNVETRTFGNKRLLFINKTDVQRLRSRLASLIYVEEFIAEHMIDWPTYYGLRAGKVLDPVIVGGRRYVSRHQLSALISQLELVCSPKPAGLLIDLPLFGQPTRGLCQTVQTYAALVRAALSGKFPVYRTLDSSGLTAFRVGKEALAWLHTEGLVAMRQVQQSRLRDTRQLDLLEA